MKKSFLRWACCFMLFSVQAYCQSATDQRLDISFNKTTSIVFPYNIIFVDKGSPDILARKAAGIENVLLIKAGKELFEETNLTVITADGKLHHFTVQYSEQAPQGTMTIPEGPVHEQAPLIFPDNVVNTQQLQVVSKKVLQHYGRPMQRKRGHDMVLTVHPIRVWEDILFYKVNLRNKSAINYDIKSLKFYIRDRKTVKRTSTQEVEAVPVHVENEESKVIGYASAEMVFVIRKFTIPDGKILHIELFEQDGGRNLTVKLSNSDILKATPIRITEDLLTIKN